MLIFESDGDAVCSTLDQISPTAQLSVRVQALNLSESVYPNLVLGSRRKILCAQLSSSDHKHHASMYQLKVLRGDHTACLHVDKYRQASEVNIRRVQQATSIILNITSYLQTAVSLQGQR